MRLLRAHICRAADLGGLLRRLLVAAVRRGGRRLDLSFRALSTVLHARDSLALWEQWLEEESASADRHNGSSGDLRRLRSLQAAASRFLDSLARLAVTWRDSDANTVRLTDSINAAVSAAAIARLVGFATAAPLIVSKAKGISEARRRQGRGEKRGVELRSRNPYIDRVLREERSRRRQGMSDEEEEDEDDFADLEDWIVP